MKELVIRVRFEGANMAESPISQVQDIMYNLDTEMSNHSDLDWLRHTKSLFDFNGNRIGSAQVTERE